MTTLHKRNEERTHEENQERALIAASHRGDRSMEARLESARKASEIHKKRTGKPLRISEQAVRDELNYEEMDEEAEQRAKEEGRDGIEEDLIAEKGQKEKYPTH